MKLFLVIVLFPFCLLAQYNISITVEGVADSTAFLGYHFQDKKYVTDTSVFQNGKTVFEGNQKLLPGIYFVYSSDFYHEIIVPADDQEFSIHTDKGKSIMNAKISGSIENELFKEFQMNMVENQSSIRELTARLGEPGADSTTIISDLRAANKSMTDYQKNFINEHPNSLVSQVMALMIKPDLPPAPVGTTAQQARAYQLNYFRDHYWDNIDFSNPGILRTPIFFPRLNEFMDKYTYQQPDSLIVTADYLLEKASQNKEVFQFVLATITNKYNQSKVMGMDAVFVHLAEKYYLTGKATWATDDLIESFSEAVGKLKPNLIGSPAPRLVVRDTLLDVVNALNLDAQYTILYFYSPTCGHCKKSTPVMLDNWRGVADQGIDLIAVNVEKDIEEWKKFIREYDLDCVNAADPFTQSNFRYEYNVETTPTIYVLDADKKIIAKKLDTEQVIDFIQRHRQLNN